MNPEGQGRAEVSVEQNQFGNVGSQSKTPLSEPKNFTHSETTHPLPPIPSFSEFVTQKGKEDGANIASKSRFNNHSSTRVQKDAAMKRMRLQ